VSAGLPRRALSACPGLGEVRGEACSFYLIAPPFFLSVPGQRQAGLERCHILNSFHQIGYADWSGIARREAWDLRWRERGPGRAPVHRGLTMLFRIIAGCLILAAYLSTGCCCWHHWHGRCCYQPCPAPRPVVVVPAG